MLADRVEADVRRLFRDYKGLLVPPAENQGLWSSTGKNKQPWSRYKASPKEESAAKAALWLRSQLLQVSQV